jgi:ATP-dependent Clp protease ATP-binding subunit ClpA
MADRFDKFTERARRVLTLAQEEARRFNHHYIGTEHLLLGLLAEGEGVGARVLQNLGVQLSQVRQRVEFIVGRGESTTTGEMGITPRAKKALELATDEARRLRHHYIGTEHLLLGLLREDEGLAARVLLSLGVTLPRVRDEVMVVLASEAGSTRRPFAIAREGIARAFGGRRGSSAADGEAAPLPKDNVITCRIDDRDLAALDALVEAGIRSTRSDAAAWLIHAGIESHQELFDKVYATVEEIRELRRRAQAIAEGLAAGAAGEAEDAPPEQASQGEQPAPPA